LNLSRATVWLLVLVCMLHGALGASVGLSVDEAHYALYAAHLDWSYFDHPPLVGWVQWPLVALNAPTWVLRLLPEVLWLATALLVHGLAEHLLRAAGNDASPGRAGFWAVLVLALAPLLHVLGIGLLPDTLLMFWTVAVMHATLCLLDAVTVQRPAPWLVLGVLLGLAGLSKYTSILPALAVAACLLHAHGLPMLRRPWPWLAVLLAVCLVLPVAYWNGTHHWISFTYQAQHGAGGGWQAAHVLRFLLVQLLAYGPLLAWGWVGVRHAAPKQRSLLLFCLLPFAVLATMAGGGTSLPHWTAPAWVALAPLAGMGLARTARAGRWRAVVVLAVAQAATCVVVLGLMVTGGPPLLSGTSGQGNSAQPSNPFADVHGWDEAGATARALAAQHGLRSVSVQNWTLASRLGWYARPLPVHVLEDRFDQFSLWAGNLPVGGDSLLVDWSQLAYVPPLGANGFTDCTLLATQDARRLGHTLSTFRYYACHGWSGQPQPRLLGAP